MKRAALVLGLWLVLPAAALAERHTLIVLSQSDHALYDINPLTGQLLTQVTLAGSPREAIFSWNEQQLFVSIPDAGEVAIVDVKSFKQTGSIKSPDFRPPSAGGPGAPLGLASNSDGKLYIGIQGGLLVLDSRLLLLNPEWAQTPKKIATTPRDGRYFRIHGPTDKLYYPHRQDNQVVVIDTKTDTVVKTVPVAGGPVDVVFVPGNEAWVQCEDGSIAVIDTRQDVVKQVIATGGKGPGRIAIAPDIRFIASTHADTGDTAILHPLTKQVLATIKTGRGPAVPAFAPAVKVQSDFRMKDPTTLLYVTNAGDSDVALVDLEKMGVSDRHRVGQGLIGSLIHYTFPAGFSAPREGTAKRLMETELFTARANAMALNDVSPVHEHREDMVGINTGSGVAKLGCWSPECPADDIPGPGPWYSFSNLSPGNLPYLNGDARAGDMTGVTRGRIHQEEGGSNSPRRFLLFDLKNNYYRQTAPPKPPALANTRFQKIGENGRATAWDLWLRKGETFDFPEADLIVVYLSGSLVRITRSGTPEIANRYYNDWDWEPKAHSIDALSDPLHMVVLELK